jgi:hypothetical protein
MADSEKILKLLVEMKQVGAEDVKAAKDLLDEMGQSSKIASKATEDLGEKQSDAAGKTEQLHLNHKSLHKIMHMIGKETAPELGVAMNAAFVGPLALAVAVGVAFEGIREHIRETNKELDEMGERASQAYANVKANLFDAIREEEFSTEKVDKFFKKIEDDAGKAQKAIESALKIAHELEAATVKKLRADEESELAGIKYDPNLTASQKEAAANAIKNKYAERVAGQENQGQMDEVRAAKAELAAKEKLLNDLLMQQHKAGAVSPERIEAINKLMESLSDKDALRRQFEKDKSAGTVDYAKIDIAALQKNAAAELQAMRGKLNEDEQTGRPAGEGDAKRAEDLRKKFGENIAEWEAEIDRITKALAVGKNANGTDYAPAQVVWMNESITDLKSKIAASGLDQADAAVKADKTRIEQLLNHAAQLNLAAANENKLNGEIEKLRSDVQAARQKLNETTTVARIRTGANDYVTDKSRVTRDWESFGESEKELGDIKKHPSNPQSVAKARAAIGSMFSALQDAATVINEMAARGDDVAQLRRELNALAARLNNSRNRTGG